jgi:hypothetical protein
MCLASWRADPFGRRNWRSHRAFAASDLLANIVAGNGLLASRSAAVEGEGCESRSLRCNESLKVQSLPLIVVILLAASFAGC